MNPYESPQPVTVTLVTPPAWKRLLVISIPFTSGMLASLAIGYAYSGQVGLAGANFLIATGGLFLTWRFTR